MNAKNTQFLAETNFLHNCVQEEKIKLNTNNNENTNINNTLFDI